MQSTSFNQPSAEAPQQPRPEPQCLNFVANLHGLGSAPVPLLATAATHDELFLGIERDGLFIYPKALDPPVHALIIALKHLQDRGCFPDEELFNKICALGSEEQAIYGVAPEDYQFRPDDLAIPAFKELDIGKLLGLMKLTARYFEEFSETFFSHPDKHHYQVGVITLQTNAGGRATWRAQLFPTQQGVHPTGTLWLHRKCTFDTAGDYTEQWYGLGNGGLGFSAPPTTSEQPAMVRSAPGVTGHGSRLEIDSSTSLQDRFLSAPAVKCKPTKKPTKSTLPDFTGPPDSNLFRDDPKTITGETIYRLAYHYSNQELFELINAGLKAKRLALVKNVNAICRRITVAIETIAKEERKTEVELRESMRDARKTNGVNKRTQARAAARRAATRERQAQSQTPNAGEG